MCTYFCGYRHEIVVSRPVVSVRFILPFVHSMEGGPKKLHTHPFLSVDVYNNKYVIKQWFYWYFKIIMSIEQ